MRPLIFVLCAASLALSSWAAEWQWSVPMGNGRAFLWIPPNCERVQALVLAQNNMIEEGILESAEMRRTLTELGMAEVLVSPPFDPVYAFDQGAKVRFQAMLQALYDISGYGELAKAPVAPLGHSACASFPWNFAAANPERTLAVLSVKGDAPQTDLTGSGKPNPAWVERTIDGIPGLLVMSEQEWWDARLRPASAFRLAHPRTPLAVLADVGHGHFDATEPLIRFVCAFIRKAAAARLPGLRPVDPAAGWLVDRWRADDPALAPPAPAAEFRGDRAEAFWCFDEEMARSTEELYARSRGKRRQQVDFVQGGQFAPLSSSHAGVELAFRPEADGLTFTLHGGFIEPIPPRPPLAAKDQAPPITRIQPQAAPPSQHADGAVQVLRIVGPATQLDPGTFRVALNRMAPAGDPRSRSIWLVALHPGNATFKGAVQQALLTLPAHSQGPVPTITFEPIPDQPVGTTAVTLHAQSSEAETPVQFFVREGPAEIAGNTLTFTHVPPRSAFSVKVTVVAWQLGRDDAPAYRDATPVEQTFLLTR